jgi:hypothetical protein
MSINVNDIIGKLSPARRKQVEARAAQLIAEEIELRQLQISPESEQIPRV